MWASLYTQRQTDYTCPTRFLLESGTHPAKSLNLLHQIVYSPSRLHTRTKRKTTSFQLPNLNGNSERVMMIEHLDLDLSIRFYEKFPYLYSSIRVYAYIYSEFIQEVMLLVDLSCTFRLFPTRLRWPCLQEP